MKLATTLLFEASFPFWFESLRVDFAVVLNWKSFDIEVDGVAEIHVVFTHLSLVLDPVDESIQSCSFEADTL